MLASGVDPNEPAPPRISALCGACYKGNLELVSMLLAAGADPSGSINIGHPLYYAVRTTCGDRGLRISYSLTKLLVDAGADFERRGQVAYTMEPIAEAILRGRRRLLPLLLRAGAALVTTNVARREHTPAFKSCWALVDKVRKAKGFDEYAKHHARLITNVIAKCFAPGALPQEIYAVVATFVAPHGGS